MKQFDFEQLYTYWALRDLIQLSPWRDEHCDDGTVMKLSLYNRETKQQMTVAYKRFWDGHCELKHVQTDHSTSVSQNSDGTVRYHISEETYYDDEAQEKMDAI